jgi:magnesium-protoporphyrin O-methyltransferase
MTCCHCEATEHQFNDAAARRDIRRYRRKGPDSTTQEILEAVRGPHLKGASLLDVGGGIGVIVHELMSEGIESATLVEAASAYIRAAEDEASQRQHPGRLSVAHGDFVELAAKLHSADVVTLDRVVCCYPDFEHLLEAAAAKTEHMLGLSYPRGRWHVKVVVAIQNAFRRLTGNPFRTFVHSTRRMHELLSTAGLERCHERSTMVWQVAVYRAPA